MRLSDEGQELLNLRIDDFCETQRLSYSEVHFKLALRDSTKEVNEAYQETYRMFLHILAFNISTMCETAYTSEDIALEQSDISEIETLIVERFKTTLLSPQITNHPAIAGVSWTETMNNMVARQKRRLEIESRQAILRKKLPTQASQYPEVSSPTIKVPTPSQTKTDRELMLRAIELARKCMSEAGKVSPKVGAVVARDGVILGEAYRGEITPGDHAEFTLLEKMLSDKTLAGATLFSTLEPCTKRGPSKISCAQRVIDRRIAKVFIGALDRNPEIRGEGETMLLDAGIQVARFDSDLIPVIEELNREFLREMKIKRTKAETKDPVEPEAIGPNGFKLGYTEEGDKVEWIIEEGETWPMILRRNDKAILEMYNELWEKVWYIRKLIHLEKMERGEIPYEDQNQPHLIKAEQRMRQIEEKYGVENLGWGDVEWGIVQGRLSALSWVMGSEWEESLDT